MHVLVKRSAEFLLLRSGLLRAARARRRGETLVLAYHNIVPRGESAQGDASLHLPQSDFADQLDVLAATHEVVPITRMLEPGDSAARPRAVITFDDGYTGAVSAGVEELQRRSLPATFFITPGFVGGRTFWWDELGAAYGGALPDQVRAYAIAQLGGKHDAILDWASEVGLELSTLPAHQCAATAAQLSAAGADGLVTFGSHSWSHANLSALGAIELRHELNESMAWLSSRLRSVVPWISYPYGLSSRVVQLAAAECGYAGGLAIDGGWLSPAPGETHFCVPRTNVPAGISAAGFTILASGLLASAARPVGAVPASP